MGNKVTKINLKDKDVKRLSQVTGCTYTSR
jgi:hypothetical protein